MGKLVWNLRCRKGKAAYVRRLPLAYAEGVSSMTLKCKPLMVMASEWELTRFHGLTNVTTGDWADVTVIPGTEGKL